MINLINADCTEALKQIPDNSIDLILTDPPYGLANFCKDRQSNIHTMRPNHFTQSSWDKFDNKGFDTLMSDFLSQAQRVLRRGGGGDYIHSHVENQ